MRVPTLLLLTLATTSCTTPPADHVIHRAWCETEQRWISQDWHLTNTEAEAQVSLHRCNHPDHRVTYLSTPGPLPERVSQAPLSPEMRRLLFLRDR